MTKIVFVSAGREVVAKYTGRVCGRVEHIPHCTDPTCNDLCIQKYASINGIAHGLCSGGACACLYPC